MDELILTLFHPRYRHLVPKTTVFLSPVQTIHFVFHMAFSGCFTKIIALFVILFCTVNVLGHPQCVDDASYVCNAKCEDITAMMNKENSRSTWNKR